MAGFRVHRDEAVSRGFVPGRRHRANGRNARQRHQYDVRSQGPVGRLHDENVAPLRARPGSAFGNGSTSGFGPTGVQQGTASEDQENFPPNNSSHAGHGNHSVGPLEGRCDQSGHAHSIQSQVYHGYLHGVSQMPARMGESSAWAQGLGQDGRGRKREPYPTPGMVCYLHKDIASHVLKKQVSKLDYMEILGHPVVILAPSPRSGQVVFAKITTFGGKSLDERCGQGDAGTKLRNQYLPIRDGDKEYSGDVPVLEVKGGRRFDRQSFVNVARKNVLSIEAFHLPPFRKKTSVGVEFEVTRDSLKAIVEHYEGMTEKEEQRPTQKGATTLSSSQGATSASTFATLLSPLVPSSTGASQSPKPPTMHQTGASSSNWRLGASPENASAASRPPPVSRRSFPGAERAGWQLKNWRDAPKPQRAYTWSGPGAAKGSRWKEDDDWRSHASPSQQHDNPEEASNIAETCEQPRPHLVPGKICFINEGINSDALHQQVVAEREKDILGHPVVILPFPAKRPGCRVIATVTSFLSTPIDEKFSKPGQESLKARYLPIAHGEEDHGNGQMLRLEDDRKLSKRSYVNVYPRDLLEIETCFLPAFQRGSVEFDLTEASMDALERHIEGLLERLYEEERFRFGDRRCKLSGGSGLAGKECIKHVNSKS
ncbi:hypothetical protein IWX90DRAFT_482197 [Phyllosticta citrichinensis]|uniref:Uncharacterized protein n=1 Tax=Phyllosticta citrichinensis TaxID=1130410 RepID=A0ABR1Y612_9PEZI